MTLTTFDMQKHCEERIMQLDLTAKSHNPLDFINHFLPDDFPGSISIFRNDRSEHSLSGVLVAIIEFDEFGSEIIEMEVPLMTQDIDIFEAFAKCIKERLVHLKAKNG